MRGRLKLIVVQKSGVVIVIVTSFALAATFEVCSALTTTPRHTYGFREGTHRSLKSSERHGQSPRLMGLRAGQINTHDIFEDIGACWSAKPSRSLYQTLAPRACFVANDSGAGDGKRALFTAGQHFLLKRGLTRPHDGNGWF